MILSNPLHEGILSFVGASLVISVFSQSWGIVQLIYNLQQAFSKFHQLELLEKSRFVWVYCFSIYLILCCIYVLHHIRLFINNECIYLPVIYGRFCLLLVLPCMIVWSTADNYLHQYLSGNDNVCCRGAIFHATLFSKCTNCMHCRLS